MTAYKDMTLDQRRAEYAALQTAFADLKAQGLKLDMTRGKPCKDQLDMVSDIFDMLKEPEDYDPKYKKWTLEDLPIFFPVPFPVSWTVKMKKKQKETQDILSYHSQAAGCSDKARAKASGGRQPIEECGRTGL